MVVITKDQKSFDQANLNWPNYQVVKVKENVNIDNYRTKLEDKGISSFYYELNNVSCPNYSDRKYFSEHAFGLISISRNTPRFN